VTAAQSNYPMALDEATHRLFIGCRSPAKVLIYDTASGRLLGGVDTVGDTDDLFYDAARRRLYVTGGEGAIDVFQRNEADVFSRIGRVPTAAGARTSLFVFQQARLFVAVPHRGTQKAEVRAFRASDAR
jgi:hypothetical protein